MAWLAVTHASAAAALRFPCNPFRVGVCPPFRGYTYATPLGTGGEDKRGCLAITG